MKVGSHRNLPRTHVKRAILHALVRSTLNPLDILVLSTITQPHLMLLILALQFRIVIGQLKDEY